MRTISLSSHIVYFRNEYETSKTNNTTSGFMLYSLKKKSHLSLSLLICCTLESGASLTFIAHLNLSLAFKSISETSSMAVFV